MTTETTEIKAGLSAQSGFDAHPATKSKTTKLEKKIIRLAQQIGCEARGGVPLGKNYTEMPSWEVWMEMARNELIVRYAKKYPKAFNAVLESLL